MRFTPWQPAKAVPDAALLDDMVRRYPQFSDELTDYAIAIAIDALRGDAAVEAAEAARDPMVMSPAVLARHEPLQNRLHAVSGEGDARATAPRSNIADAPNPFAALSRDEFRAFATRLDANSVFVAKLRDRQIEPATLTRVSASVSPTICVRRSMWWWWRISRRHKARLRDRNSTS